MAGRPRLYASAAEKTRAYRERQRQHISELDGWAEQSVDEMARLRRSVIIAQGRGDALALSLRTENLTDLMEDLALHFSSVTVAPQKPGTGGTSATQHGRNREEIRRNSNPSSNT
jgi:hypothetical protein